MAKIIYREGMEGQNNLSCIEGIEIDLINGQKALIYPKYELEPILSKDKVKEWKAPNLTEIDALRVTDTKQATEELIKLGSPAVLWVNQFKSDNHGAFCLPSLLAAMEISRQSEEIDNLAETIEGADLMIEFNTSIWSCCRFNSDRCWFLHGGSGCVVYSDLFSSYLVVPTILY